MIYCSIPFLSMLAAAAIYSDDIKELQKPEITVFLAKEVSPDKATLLAKMAAAVSFTNQITIVEPKTAATQVAKTLNLSTELLEAIKFPRTIQIVFPKDADPVVMEELAQLLVADSRVAHVHSNLETYNLFQRAGSHWFLLLSVGFCLTGLFNLLFGYFLISFISRPHLSEMSKMFLLGVPNLKNSLPLQIFGLVLGVFYLFGCYAVYPALLNGIIISADWLFYFYGLTEAKIGPPSAKVLISLVVMFVVFLTGVYFAIKKVHVSIWKLASQS